VLIVVVNQNQISNFNIFRTKFLRPDLSSKLGHEIFNNFLIRHSFTHLKPQSQLQTTDEIKQALETGTSKTSKAWSQQLIYEFAFVV